MQPKEKFMENNYCFYLSSVKWGEGEKLGPYQIRQRSRKFAAFFNSHDLVLNLGQWSLPAVIPASFPFVFGKRFSHGPATLCKDIASVWACTQIGQCFYFASKAIHFPRRFLPCLKVFYSGKHIKMPCWVLLYHILYIIRPQSLLEFFFIETKL